MTKVKLADRVATLEAEFARLKARIDALGKAKLPWWEQIAGSFANDPAYEEAMRLGREWRESFRSKPKNRKSDDGVR